VASDGLLLANSNELVPDEKATTICLEAVQ
jgi:hypothetical protein